MHAPADAWFVDGFLLEAVGLADGEVLVSSKLELGSVIVNEIERGAASPVTVVVVSPAFLASPWAQFAHQLAMHQSIEAANDGSATLMPALLADCELPLLSRFRVPLDFRNQARAHWDAEAERLRKKLAANLPVVAQLPCPYPGMQPFKTEDATRFHGRTQEVTDLLGRLRDGQRELYVIGPSGSGKSSLVAAGLVPSLRHSPELAGGAFVVRQLRPGSDPAAALAGVLEATAVERSDAAMRWLGDAVGRVLANHPDHGRLLIVVDQLEELFTTAETDARAAFIAAVRVLRSDVRVALVLTLRADFYASLMESALWADLDGRLSKLEVSPLRGARLRTVIEAPARALGVYFEPVLVERLLHDVADEPGALPLLQDALLDLWHRRARSLLRLADYDAMSDGVQTGLAVTVARRANGALNELSPGRQQIARRVLLRLVQFGDGAVTTRRQQARAALSAARDAPEDVDAVVRHLADRRLLTTSGGDDADPSARVDLAHEILLSAWPALAEWIRTRKDDEQRRRELEAKAAEWVKSGRGRSRLLDADELREVHGWLGEPNARDLGVSEEIQRFIARSDAAQTAQVAETEGRRRRWRRWVTVALVVLSGAVVAVSMLAVIAGRRSREAAKQTAVADRNSQELKRQLARSYVSQGQSLLMNGHPSQAVPYLVAAREAGVEDVSLRALFRWAVQGLPLLHHGPVYAVAWRPDGRRLATASEDGTALVWDAVSGKLAAPPLAHHGAVTAVTWSPDGTRVATASHDRTAQVWDAVSGKPVTPRITHQGAVTAVTWSPDGTRVATASYDKTAQVWDAVSGKAMTPALAHDAEVTAVAWSPDGKWIATASHDHTARVWDAVSGKPVTPPLAHRGSVVAVAWSPDGTKVATASDDKTARVWDAASGKPVTPWLGHQSNVMMVAWSPNGKRIATASFDETAQVWDAVNGQAVTPPLAHQGFVMAVAWSPDGARVATASADRTARVWDAVSGQVVTPPLVHEGDVNAVAWSPDGMRVATASNDNTAQVWDAVSGQAVTPPLAHQGQVVAAVWSPDGTRIATASLDKTARVWDAISGKATRSFAHADAVNAVAWSPDGTRVATASYDRTAQVWDAVSGKAVTPPLAHQGVVRMVAWSPDGTRVATASDDKTAQVWDAVSGKPVTPSLAHEDGLTAVAWSPDGTRVATASADNTARVWDAVSGKAVTPPLAHKDLVTAVAWSPDGARVATASFDRTVQVWDAVNGKAVTPPLLHWGVVRAVTWSPDGTRIATASDDQTARVWDAISGQAVTPPLAHAREVKAVAWSPDGTRIATAGEDNTARVWDAVSGQAVTPPLAHAREVNAVAWSADGKRLATASGDSTARVWDVSWDAGTLADWRAARDHRDYRLNREGVLVRARTSGTVSSLPSSHGSAAPD